MERFNLDFEVLSLALNDASAGGMLGLLILALGVACAFEFVNGFHDTANAVATVIYTRSLRPWAAVIWSGFCNFLGVFLGGIAVAMGIIKLLPVELLSNGSMAMGLAMVFAMLLSAVTWNLGTWYFGIPASSSHTMIGALLGIGLGNAYLNSLPLSSGVNWGKAADVGAALMISPAVGFGLSALGVFLLKRFAANSRIHHAPQGLERPPLGVRLALIGTSTGVSLAHGSNDGQKGVGLIMLILIAVLPESFALNPHALNSEARLVEARESTHKISLAIWSEQFPKSLPVAQVAVSSAGGSLSAIKYRGILPGEKLETQSSLLVRLTSDIDLLLVKAQSAQGLELGERFRLRSKIFQLDSALKKLENDKPEWSKEIKAERKRLLSLTEYAPIWVLVIVALSLGVGTLFGWKRIVVTIGEKIGKAHLTYAQGAVSELVAMSTIALSAAAGVPVSTTHCLSSGIAGGMFANRSGVQKGTVSKIVLAWILTLPATIALSAGLFVLFAKIFVS